MTTAKRVRLIYGIVLSVSLIIAGLCLMAECVSIYQSGDRPFSRESVAQSFSGIAVPVYLALALIIGGFILDFTLPAENRKHAPEKNYAMILRRLWEKRELKECEPSLQQAILSQQKRRKLHAEISVALLILGSILFLSYGANSANFHQSDINGSMVKAVCVLSGCLAVPFGYAVFSAYLTKASLQKEIALVKQIEAGDRKPPISAKKNAARPMHILRWVLLCVGVVILVYGYATGGTLDVLTKAVNICTECVGLG